MKARLFRTDLTYIGVVRYTLAFLEIRFMDSLPTRQHTCDDGFPEFRAAGGSVRPPAGTVWR